MSSSGHTHRLPSVMKGLEPDVSPGATGPLGPVISTKSRCRPWPPRQVGSKRSLGLATMRATSRITICSGISKLAAPARGWPRATHTEPLDATQQHLLAIGRAYREFQATHRRPPKEAAEILPILEQIGASEDVFRSDRDGQPLVELSSDELRARQGLLEGQLQEYGVEERAARAKNDPAVVKVARDRIDVISKSLADVRRKIDELIVRKLTVLDVGRPE